MTNEMTAPQNIRAIDSLVANEFEVRIDNEPVSGIFSIAGLVTFKLEVRTTTSMKKLTTPFKVTKMVQRDPHNNFNTWIRETFAAKADIERPTRTLTVLAIDNGVEIRRWTIQKAWISEISYSDFNTSSSEMVEETITIQYDDVEETWPLLNAPEQLPASTN